MDGVKRYIATGVSQVLGGEFPAHERFVFASDFDAALAREAALREELAAAKRSEHNSEVAYKAAIEKQEELREELYQSKEARDAEMLSGIRLQKSLTAAEQRNAECIALLRRSTSAEGQDHKTWWNDRALILQAALKPTKSGASE